MAQERHEAAAVQGAGAGAASAPGAPAPHDIIDGRLSRGILRFGLPLTAAMALQSTFNLVDMLIVGALPNGTSALGVLALCDVAAMVPTILGNGIANATVAIVARRVGEGDRDGVSLTTWQSMGLTAALALAFGVVGVAFAEPITADLLGAKGEVATLGAAYLQVILGGCFTILLLFQLAAIMRALGDARTPMLLLVGANVLNLPLTVLMVYGPGDAPALLAWGPPVAAALGIPAMGVVGAAWSTLASRLVAIVLGTVILVADRRHGLRWRARDLVPRLAPAAALLRIAWPSSAQFLLRIGVTLFFLGIVATHFTTADDPSTLAAFGICIRLETLALFTAMGWGAAASTYVGQNLGAGRPRRASAAGWYATAWCQATLAALIALYLLVPGPIVSLFDASPAVVTRGAEYLRIVAPTYLFLGVAVVLSQGLSGAGATLSSLVVDAAVLLGAVIPATVLWVNLGGFERESTWWLIASGNVLSAGAYAVWFATDRWQGKAL